MRTFPIKNGNVNKLNLIVCVGFRAPSSRTKAQDCHDIDRFGTMRILQRLRSFLRNKERLGMSDRLFTKMFCGKEGVCAVVFFPF